MKTLFSDVKRFIEKMYGEEEGGPNCGKTTLARDTMQGGKGISSVYQKYASQAREKPQTSEKLNKREFTDFIKFVTREIKLDADIGELYLYFGKKLSVLQQKGAKGSPTEPKKRPRSSFIQKPGTPTANDKQDLKDYALDLHLVKVAFDKWYKEEESLSGVLNPKITK